MEKHKEGGFEGVGTGSTRYGKREFHNPLSPPPPPPIRYYFHPCYLGDIAEICDNDNLISKFSLLGEILVSKDL